MHIHFYGDVSQDTRVCYVQSSKVPGLLSEKLRYCKDVQN